LFLSLARVSIARKRTRQTERSHAYVAGRREQGGFRRIYEEGLNRGNLAVADEVVDPDCLDHEAHPGGDRGPESIRALITMLRTAFPDLHFAIEHLVA
jgi:predicted ester cyclase